MNTNVFRVALAAVCCTLFSLSAQAATPGWYIGGEGGASFLNDADNTLIRTFNTPAVPGTPGTPGTPATPPGPCTGGTPGTPGSGLLILPGLITVLPTPGTPGTPCTPGAPGTPGTPATPGTPGTPAGVQQQRDDFKTSYDIGFIGGLTVGRLFANGIRTELELRYSQNDLDSVKGSLGGFSTNGKISSGAVMANLFYDFFPAGRFHPYVGGGVGGARVQLDSGGRDNDIVFAYQGGAGLAVDLSERLTFDAGYRYFTTEDPSFGSGNDRLNFEYEQHAALLSLRYVIAPTGRKDSDGDGVPDIYDNCPNTPVGAPVDAKGCPLDSDGDGVPDYLDNCPNTPAGVPVDSQGCPLDSDGDGVPDYLDECPNTPQGAPVDDRGCPLDSDGDGVPDYMDDCPNTPAGAVVNARGCPTVVDSDGDGVPDDLDQCPDTPPGVAVTSTGCAVGQSVILRGVNYGFNRSSLTPNAERVLDGVVRTLQDSPGFAIELSGHTDSIGSDAYNLNLSQLRAESARNYLISQGVDPSRIQARGYGATQPIAPNTHPDGSDNPDGRAQNRRTEIKILKN